MKVYVVTTGECDDDRDTYRIEGIFSTPEKADEYIAARKAIRDRSDFNDVLAIDMDGGDADLVTRMAAQGMTAWLCLVLAKGTTIQADRFYRQDIVYPSLAWASYGPHLSEMLTIYCFARNKRHAIKIAAEMYAKAIAERDQGVTTPA